MSAMASNPICTIRRKQKKAIHHGQPIFIVNLKSNTMKNTVQIYRLLCYVAYFFTWKIHSLNHV